MREPVLTIDRLPREEPCVQTGEVGTARGIIQLVVGQLHNASSSKDEPASTGASPTIKHVAVSSVGHLVHAIANIRCFPDNIARKVRYMQNIRQVEFTTFRSADDERGLLDR